MNPRNDTTDTQLRQALRGLASEISAANPTPPASAIYLRAERRSRQLAIARATRPLRIMQILGIVSAVLIATWAIHQSWTSPDSALTPHATTSLLAWGALALLIVLSGCWAMLLASRRPSTQTPS